MNHPVSQFQDNIRRNENMCRSAFRAWWKLRHPRNPKDKRKTPQGRAQFPVRIRLRGYITLLRDAPNLTQDVRGM